MDDQHQRLDPKAWEGDNYNLLFRHRYELLNDPQLCDAVFVNRHEAFYGGIEVGLLMKPTQATVRPSCSSSQPGANIHDPVRKNRPTRDDGF